MNDDAGVAVSTRPLSFFQESAAARAESEAKISSIKAETDELLARLGIGRKPPSSQQGGRTASASVLTPAKS